VVKNSGRSPHPRCLVCTEDEACGFHSAANPMELAQAAIGALREGASLGLASMIAAMLARVGEMIPPEALKGISSLGTGKLKDRFADLLDLDGYSPEDLRELASVSLALALIEESREGKRSRKSVKDKVR
jgi:hypothetical protein